MEKQIINFARFLQERHARDYVGTDDMMPEAYDEWVQNMDIEDMIELCQIYATLCYRDGRTDGAIECQKDLAAFIDNKKAGA